MLYFTRELWLSAQKAGQLEQYEQNWRQANDKYQAQLEALKPRLNPNAHTFFLEADVHDGELLDLVVEDGSRPAPLSEPVRPWKATIRYPIKASLTVLDGNDRFVWKLSYAFVRRLVIDFPSSDPLFYSEGEGFGDWGYHELADAGNGFLRHEILFATGAVLLFEFKDIAITCMPRSLTGSDDTASK
jgi:hypothetical protein